MDVKILTIEDVLDSPLFKKKVEEIVKTKTEKMFTREEASEHLRISVPTLDRHIKAGLIKTRKQGARVLIPESELTKN